MAFTVIPIADGYGPLNQTAIEFAVGTFQPETARLLVRRDRAATKAGGRSPAMPAVGQSRGRLEGNSNTLLPDEADHLGLVGLHLQLVLGVSYGKVTR